MPSPSSRPGQWLVVLAVVLTLASCGGGAERPRTLRVGNDDVPARQLTDAVAGLCEARRQAATNASASKATFYDRAHADIHTIARALEPIDRAEAARLLEAKQAVEADLSPNASPNPSLADDLGRLLDATEAGLARLSVSAPRCTEP